MRRLGRLSRRTFGQSLGVSLALILQQRLGGATISSPAKVRIRQFAFEPSNLTIKRGDTVEWTNLDIAPHTATSEDGAWDTGGLAQNQLGEITFAQAGSFSYRCAFHPHMRGLIQVE